MTEYSEWRFLNRIDTPDYPDAEWRRICQQSYSFIQKYLKPTGSYEAVSLPCPHAPYAINARHVVYDYGENIEEEGIDCGCGLHTLKHEDISRKVFSHKDFAADIASAFGLEENYRELETGCYQIGELRRRRKNVRHVYLCRGSSAVLLETRVKRIVLQDRDAPIILLPEKISNADIKDAVEFVGGSLLRLSEYLTITQNGMAVLASIDAYLSESAVHHQKRVRIPVPTGTQWTDIGLYYDKENDRFDVRVYGKQYDVSLNAHNMQLTKGKGINTKAYELLVRFAYEGLHISEYKMSPDDRKSWAPHKRELEKCFQEIFGIAQPAFDSINPKHEHAKNKISGWKPCFEIRTTEFLKERERLRNYIKKRGYDEDEFSERI